MTTGIRGETVDEILFLDQDSDPSELGMVKLVDGIFKFVDGEGVYNPRAGITEAQHETLDSLVHELSETSYMEVTRVLGKVTHVIFWTDVGKTTKIRETAIQRSGGKVSQIDFIQYNSSGTEKQRLTGVITRTSGQVSSIAWIETIS